MLVECVQGQEDYASLDRKRRYTHLTEKQEAGTGEGGEVVFGENVTPGISEGKCSRGYHKFKRSRSAMQVVVVVVRWGE